ncbi:hypothetical protein [Methylobacterium brachiatum]|uniref:hypothetical protein n=1 Tax=Methylobacterium brachiatum TaxID=269660 RepID=UPI0013CF3BBB|nr:hypothetical protein [Methylobacterium brachiatum]
MKTLLDIVISLDASSDRWCVAKNVSVFWLFRLLCRSEHDRSTRGVVLTIRICADDTAARARAREKVAGRDDLAFVLGRVEPMHRQARARAGSASRPEWLGPVESAASRACGGSDVAFLQLGHAHSDEGLVFIGNP